MFPTFKQTKAGDATVRSAKSQSGHVMTLIGVACNVQHQFSGSPDMRTRESLAKGNALTGPSSQLKGTCTMKPQDTHQAKFTHIHTRARARWFTVRDSRFEVN
jgi:hypothetical protein